MSFLNKHYREVSYALCGAIIVGAIGPWFSDPIFYRGTSMGGILALLGASAAAATLALVFRLSSKVAMMATLALASLCTMAAAHAVYTFSFDSKAILADQIGWGLIVTLIASITLTALTVVRYRSVFPRTMRFVVWRTHAGLTVGVVAAIFMGLGGVSAVSFVSADRELRPWTAERSKRGKVDRKLQIASARSNGVAWSMRLFGNRRGESCWSMKWVKEQGPLKDEELLSKEVSYCDMDVPPRQWELAAEAPHGEKGGREWVLVFFTRLDVAHLKVLTGRIVKMAQGKWTRAKAQRIGAGQARKARLRPKFGYAVIRVPSPGCLRRVIVVDQTGQQVKRTPIFRCRRGSFEPLPGMITIE